MINLSSLDPSAGWQPGPAGRLCPPAKSTRYAALCSPRRVWPSSAIWSHNNFCSGVDRRHRHLAAWSSWSAVPSRREPHAHSPLLTWPSAAELRDLIPHRLLPSSGLHAQGPCSLRQLRRRVQRTQPVGCRHVIQVCPCQASRPGGSAGARDVRGLAPGGRMGD